MEKKKVLLLYTGGTMGMKPIENGSLSPEPGYLTDRINELPEMMRPEMPSFDIKEYDPLLVDILLGGTY